MREKIFSSFLCSVFAITTTIYPTNDVSTQTNFSQSNDSTQTELSLQQLAAQLMDGEKMTAIPLVLAVNASGHVRVIDPDILISPSKQVTVQLPATDYDLLKEALVLCVEGVGKGTTGVLILTWLGGKIVFQTTVRAGARTWDFLKYLVHDVIVPKITAANTPEDNDNNNDYVDG